MEIGHEGKYICRLDSVGDCKEKRKREDETCQDWDPLDPIEKWDQRTPVHEGQKQTRAAVQHAGQAEQRGRRGKGTKPEDGVACWDWIASRSASRLCTPLPANSERVVNVLTIDFLSSHSQRPSHSKPSFALWPPRSTSRDCRFYVVLSRKAQQWRFGPSWWDCSPITSVRSDLFAVVPLLRAAVHCGAFIADSNFSNPKNPSALGRSASLFAVTRQQRCGCVRRGVVCPLPLSSVDPNLAFRALAVPKEVGHDRFLGDRCPYCPQQCRMFSAMSETAQFAFRNTRTVFTCTGFGRHAGRIRWLASYATDLARTLVRWKYGWGR